MIPDAILLMIFWKVSEIATTKKDMIATKNVGESTNKSEKTKISQIIFIIKIERYFVKIFIFRFSNMSIKTVLEIYTITFKIMRFKRIGSHPEKKYILNVINVSIVYIKKRDYKAAEAQLDHALTLQPENTKILARAVQLQMLLKKPQNALQKCRDHIKKVPSKEAGIRILISQVYGAQKDFDRAEKEITQAMNLKPDSMVPYTAMGRLLLAEGKVDQGIEAFESALEKNPDSVQLKFLIATLHEKKEDYSAAVNSYVTVLKEHPGFIPALNNLAYLYADRFANRENLDQAQKLLAEIPKERFNAYILDTIGLVHHKKEEYKEAIEVLKSAESKNDLPIVQLHLALAYIKTDQRGLALEAIEKALMNDGRGLSDADLKLAEDTRSMLNRL